VCPFRLLSHPKATPDNFVDNKGFDDFLLRFDESRSRDYDTGSPTFGLQLLPPQALNGDPFVRPAVVVNLLQKLLLGS